MSNAANIRNRRESHAKPRDTRPLFTTEALPTERKPRPQPQPKKRTRTPPSTSVLTFNPKENRIRSGRQDPSPLTARFSPGTPNGGSLEERADFPPYGTTNELPFSSEPHIGYDSLPHKRPRVFSDPSSSRQAPPNHEMASPSLEYDSPLSYTSSSSPATSDQSPTTFPEGPGYETNLQISPTSENLYHSPPYSPAVQGDEQYVYGHVGVANYSIPYPDTNYGRVAPNGVPSYTANYRPPPSHQFDVHHPGL
ncbi:hypothetical protein F5141DRAFT_1061187 [Pisolithus sp. B1]|nr:hypothetical protein F5141DRAFT_1061187 [Pisolithus sp. B1]